MKIIKTIFLSFFGLTLLLGAGIIAFVAFTDLNNFKPLISDQIKKSTGRELSLNGQLEWSFWPKIKIKTGPVILENHAAFEEKEFFAVDNI